MEETFNDDQDNRNVENSLYQIRRELEKRADTGDIQVIKLLARHYEKEIEYLYELMQIHGTRCREIAYLQEQKMYCYKRAADANDIYYLRRKTPPFRAEDVRRRFFLALLLPLCYNSFAR